MFAIADTLCMSNTAWMHLILGLLAMQSDLRQHKNAILSLQVFPDSVQINQCAAPIDASFSPEEKPLVKTVVASCHLRTYHPQTGCVGGCQTSAERLHVAVLEGDLKFKSSKSVFPEIQQTCQRCFPEVTGTTLRSLH